ncbi:MAG: hypothetical protein ACKVVP_24085 [Chloroflexota bacterium]
MHVTRWVILVGILGIMAVSITGSWLAHGAWERVRSKPLDMTELQQRIGIQMPHAVKSFVKRDDIAFRAHATLALLIERTDGAPAAVGVQWVKAAAHARSETDLQQVSRGLQWSQHRAGATEAHQRTLCSFVEGGYWTGLQREAFAAAGLRCSRPPRR